MREPVDVGAQVIAYTHPVEEALTVLQGQALVLRGDHIHEVTDVPATVLAPTDVVHAMRNIGTEPVRFAFAYPSVDRT